MIEPTCRPPCFCNSTAANAGDEPMAEWEVSQRSLNLMGQHSSPMLKVSAKAVSPPDASASANQLSPHRGDHRDQQFADFQNPAVQRRSADFQAEVPFQNHALPMQRRVVAILANDRVDNDAVTRQALLDDLWRRGR